MIVVEYVLIWIADDLLDPPVWQFGSVMILIVIIDLFITMQVQWLW